MGSYIIITIELRNSLR